MDSEQKSKAFIAGFAAVLIGNALVGQYRKGKRDKSGDKGGDFKGFGAVSSSKRRMAALQRAAAKLTRERWDYQGNPATNGPVTRMTPLSPVEVEIVAGAAAKAGLKPSQLIDDSLGINLTGFLDIADRVSMVQTARQQIRQYKKLYPDDNLEYVKRRLDNQQAALRAGIAQRQLRLAKQMVSRVLSRSDSLEHLSMQQLRDLQAVDRKNPHALVAKSLSRIRPEKGDLLNLQNHTGELGLREILTRYDTDRVIALVSCAQNYVCTHRRKEPWFKGDWRKALEGGEVVPGEAMLRELDLRPECWGTGISPEGANAVNLLGEIGWPTLRDRIQRDGCGHEQDPTSSVRELATYLQGLGSARARRMARLARKSPDLNRIIETAQIPAARLPVSVMRSDADLERAVREYSEGSDDVDDAMSRTRDRLAQMDPDWAIQEAPDEYERGKRVAELVDKVTDFLVEKSRKGKRIFIHGRDGELLAELLKRKGVKAAYGLTPRVLTTESRLKDEEKEAYTSYLKRVCPMTAIHVDTGFQGSVPKWMRQAGFQVDEIWLVSSEVPKYQIPTVLSCASENVHDIVISDLEHAAQRLLKPKGWKRGSVSYHQDAPGFWARLYGVADATGLPRQLPPGRSVMPSLPPPPLPPKRPRRMRLSPQLVPTYGGYDGFGEDDVG